MLRKVFIVLVLATLAATVAVAAPVRHAKPHHPPAHHPHNDHPIDKHPGRSSKGMSHPRTEHSRAEHPVTRHPVDHPAPKHQKKHPVEYRHNLRRAERPRYREARLERASFRRRAIMIASPLKGTLESLQRQNQMAESEGLERILDEDDLESRIEEKMLVPVPVSTGLMVNSNLPESRRYCRPWTADFLHDLAEAHDAEFHRPLIVTSAVRTVAYQEHLMRINGNAAAAEGDVASPHLTGATIDIGKKGMTRAELNWMRAWLLRLQMAGEIDAEEEFRQACFHITVYKAYDAPAPEAPLRKAGEQTTAAAADNVGGQ